MIKSFCGIRVNRQTSTSGWRYNIKRGGLEYVNPNHVSGSSDKIAQSRQSLFICEDDFCNSWGVQNWPLPPIIMPRQTREHDHTHKCINCNQTNPDCLNNAGNLDTQECQDG